MPSLYHVNNAAEWDATIPATFIGSSYLQTYKGFRVLVQTPQIQHESHVKPGGLMMVWANQLVLCTGPDCPFEGCRIKAQLMTQAPATSGPKLLVPKPDGDFHLN